MNRSVRRITDGAMMVAITAIVLILERQFAGFISSNFVFIMPLPMVLFTAKYGFKDALIPFSSIIILSVILGNPTSIFLFISTAFCGVVYGGGVFLHKSSRWLMGMTTIVMVIINIFIFLIFLIILDIDLASSLNEIKNIMSFLEVDSKYQTFGFLMSLNIFMIFLIGLLEGLITHILSVFLLRRLKIAQISQLHLLSIQPPRYVAYLLIVPIILNWLNNMVLIPIIFSQIIMFLAIIANAGLIFFGYIGINAIYVLKYNKKPSILLILFLIPFYVAIGFFYLILGQEKLASYLPESSNGGKNE